LGKRRENRRLPKGSLNEDLEAHIAEGFRD
jgi:hypothetical protein